MRKNQPVLNERTEEMYLEKVQQRHEEFGKLRFWSVRQIENIRMRETTAYEKIEDALKASGWKDIKVGDEWGGNGEFAWFRLQFTVPKEYAGKRLVAILRLGLISWHGGEGCVFIDGVPYQGIDRNHTEVTLAEKAEPGKKYDLVVECVSTEVWQYKVGKVRLEQADIAALNPEVKDYWYDLGFITKIAANLPMNSRRRVTIIRTANKSVNAFDFEAAGYDALSETARKAKKILAPLYKAPAESSALEFACAGHSHIDVAWLWPYAETIRKCSRTFSTIDRLMEEYPHFLFTQSQAQVYEYTKEHYPALYEKIKKRVKERRFEPQGSMWVEADCNVCSGESLVRQIVLGKRYFMDEFGIENEILWLPDVFGYSAALPQILKLAGLKYFMTIKLGGWNQFTKFPYSTFWWEGIDGTRVLAHFPPSDDYNSRIDPDQLTSSAEAYREKDRSEIALYPYGWGDGGGGPTEMHLEHMKRAKTLEGVPKCTPMWAGDFFKLLEKRSEDLPSWVGELYLEFHRGTYTTQARNKRFNRQSELLLRDAEMACGLAWLLGKAEYPHEQITETWKITCKNQFHDVIPGSSVTEVYKDSTEDYKKIIATGEWARGTGLDKVIGKQDKGENIAVFNSLSWERTDPVKVKVSGKAADWHVETADGQVLPSQASKADPSVLWVEPKSVPGIGKKSFKLAKGKAKTSSGIKVSTGSMENPFYLIKLDKHGLITSIYDKIAKREVLPQGARANVLQLFEDKPLSPDAWDFDFFYPEKCRELTEVEEISVEEAGPVRGALKIRRKFSGSIIEQRIVLWGSNPRIDFETYADWHEDKKLLKVAFPVNVHANSARYDIQFGSTDRPNHSNTIWDFARFEVAAQKWADLSQADYGVSLLNDCKYGYDIHGNIMRLTLLRAPKEPDPYADLGEHWFTYSLLPHQGDWRDGETVRRAYELNVPMIARLTGKPSSDKAFLSVDAPNVIIEVVKKAEREDALVVRMYECAGINADFRLAMDFPVGKAMECDLLERDLKTLKPDKGSIPLTMRPFEIKTVKLAGVR